MIGLGIMSTRAKTLLAELVCLPVEDQLEISRQLAEMHMPAVPATKDDPIRSARGMFRGSRLTEALLASREEERARERVRLARPCAP